MARKQTVTGIPWPKGQEHYKKELVERGEKMGLSEANYARMILIQFLRSGEKMTLEG